MGIQNSNYIVLLLAGILAVLLFGRDAVLEFSTGAFWAAIVGLLLFIAGWIVLAVLRGTRKELHNYIEEIREERAKGKPWLYNWIVGPAFVLNLIVMLAAAILWLSSEQLRFKQALETVPYWWVPVVLMLAGGLVLLVENLLARIRGRLD